VVLSFPQRRSGAVAAIDGELMSLPRRVELRVHPGGLKVVLPPVAAEDEAADTAEIVLTP